MQTRNPVLFLLALSLFCMAGALVFFTLEIARLGTHIPKILTSVELVSQKVEPLAETIEHVREEIPAVLQEIKHLREQVPPILAEVQQTRQHIPQVLEEVRLVRESVPPVLSEIEKVRQQVPSILDEVRATRESVNHAVNEVAVTRASIPPMLNQAQSVVNDAKELGKITSEGAVTGVFSGFLKAPFEIVGGIGKSILNLNMKGAEKLSGSDKDLMIEAVNGLAANKSIGQTRTWTNPKTGNGGDVTFKATTIVNKQECAVFDFVFRIRDKGASNSAITLCLNEALEWSALEETE